MDKKFDTTFHAWVTSKDNIDYIALEKKHLFEEYYEKDPQIVIRTIKWMTMGWATQDIAQFILKVTSSQRRSLSNLSFEKMLNVDSSILFDRYFFFPINLLHCSLKHTLFSF